jgi:hypothetical protein
MNIQKLYDHITSNITPEKALMKLLEANVFSYEKLKFNVGEEIHPLILISMATLDMNWSIAMPNDDEDINGMIIGTNEYIDGVLKK